MVLFRIPLLTILLLFITEDLFGQEKFEQKRDDDSITSAWHYHSIFTVSRDSIFTILIKNVPDRLIKKIKADPIFIYVEIDKFGNGKVKRASPVKYLGKKCSKIMVENLQSTKIWLPSFEIDKFDGRKFYSSSLLPLICKKEEFLAAIEKRAMKNKK